MLTSGDKGVGIKQIYTDLDRKFEEQQTQDKAIELGVAYINLYGFPIDYNVLGLIPKQTAKNSGVISFYKDGRNLKLGALNPSSAVNKIIETLKRESYYIQLYLISQSSFNHALTFYNRIVETKKKSPDIKIESKVSEIKVNSLKELAHRLYKVINFGIRE